MVSNMVFKVLKENWKGLLFYCCSFILGRLMSSLKIGQDIQHRKELYEERSINGEVL